MCEWLNSCVILAAALAIDVMLGCLALYLFHLLMRRPQ